jgi:hypothetical protein
VVLDVYGSEPLINLPLPPHPNHRSEKCMRQLTTKTDAAGRFYINYFWTNQPLANKNAGWMAFKAGYIASRGRSPMRSSVFATPPSAATVVLETGPGERIKAFQPTYFESARLPETQQTATRELMRSLTFATTIGCNTSHTRPHLEAFHHALAIAQTFDERMRVRSSCLGIKSAIERRGGSKPWPFDCDNLPFKHQPSPEVLAVEAEIRARTAARPE